MTAWVTTEIGDVQVIYHTRETVFHRDIPTTRRDEIRGIWIAHETLSRVFDMSSQ